jgi:pilus assembly protein CpaF
MKRDHVRELLDAQQRRLARPALGQEFLPAPRDTMSPGLTFILQEVRREIGFDCPDGAPDRARLNAFITAVAARCGLELNEFEHDEIVRHFEREQRPFGVLQELVDDEAVSDVIVTDFYRVAVQQGRRNLATDAAFPSQEIYEAFVERLLARAHTAYSTKQPICDGMIGDFARVHAVHKCLCESGPYLTIRLNRFPTVALGDLRDAGLAPEPLLAYLKALVQHGRTVLVVGEVATGKTTLTRALASSIPESEAILVIEDTPEIRLDHPHVRYVSTREENCDGAGRITPAECIRGGMRMAMNRIIFGEIRDAEAAEAFVDVCASGHPGISTIHARSAADAVTRLELFLGRAQRGVDRAVISEQIVTAVQAVVFLGICPHTGRRRIMEVKEIGPVADGVIRVREIFRYELQDSLPAWRAMSKVSAHRSAIERGPDGVVLSAYPALLELQSAQLMKEAAGADAA